MRELTNDEVKSVSGGYVGTKIPFFNGFIPGTNWPGGAPGALAGISLAWTIGIKIGGAINSFNLRFSGMSLGQAIHRSIHDDTMLY